MQNSSPRSPIVWPALMALLVLLLVLGSLFFFDYFDQSTKTDTAPKIQPDKLETEQFKASKAIPIPDKKAQLNKDASEFIDGLTPSDKVNKQDGFVNKNSIISISNQSHEQRSINQLLADPNLSPNTKITLNIDDKSQTLTLGELNKISTLDHNKSLSVTITKDTQQIPVTKIIGSDSTVADTDLFYSHRVTKQDTQGLWGIIQSGLIQRFRQGIALQNNNQQLESVVIPAHADEPLPSGLSSFLGKLLARKVDTSYAYNYKTQTMGKNPNKIYPDQQVVLIHFSPDELKQIYVFFANANPTHTQSFAISP